jgi:hypothetical protein
MKKFKNVESKLSQQLNAAPSEMGNREKPVAQSKHVESIIPTKNTQKENKKRDVQEETIQASTKPPVAVPFKKPVKDCSALANYMAQGNSECATLVTNYAASVNVDKTVFDLPEKSNKKPAVPRAPVGAGIKRQNTNEKLNEGIKKKDSNPKAEEIASAVSFQLLK